MLISRSYRHFQRYRQIVRVFTGHGFGFLVDQIGLSEFLSLRQRFLGTGEKAERLSRGARVRRALEELGPAFIKFGQLLSTRSDILPRDIIHELEKLQDQVPPFDFELVQSAVEEELGAPLPALFSSFDPIPLAAASIGQVHAARLISGEDVVVKVRRPGITRVVQTDVEIMYDIAHLVERRTPWGKYYRIVKAVDEFSRTIKDELDYTAEGRNADRFRRMFAGDGRIKIPGVFWDLTTSRVLTMERVVGTKINEVDALWLKGIDPAAIARLIADLMFRQVLVEGFFHADPHPGNVLVDDAGRIILMDFGMVGELTPDMRDRFVAFVLGIVNRDADEVTGAILEMGDALERVNLTALRRDVARLQKHYGEIPLQDIDFGDALREVIALAYNHRIAIPPEYSLLAKSMITLESLAMTLDPRLSILDLAEPYTRELLRRRFSLPNLKRVARRTVIESFRLARAIPKQFSRVLALMEEGEWKVKMELEHTDWMLSRLSSVFNRLAVAIVLASLIVGASLVLQGAQDSIFWHMPIAEYMFILSGFMGIWLVIAILRTGKF